MYSLDRKIAGGWGQVALWCTKETLRPSGPVIIQYVEFDEHSIIKDAASYSVTICQDNVILHHKHSYDHNEEPVDWYDL